jgi:hypothetical protein
MSGGSMADWRKQNSVPVLVEVLIADGSLMKGTVLVQRDKSLKDVFSGTDQFIEFECMVNGDMVLGKAAIATVRAAKQIKTDQLERKLKMLEKSDAFAVLKLPKTASREQARDAYLAMARAYHPDRFAGFELPAEVSEYLNAMARSINSAYSELNMLMGGGSLESDEAEAA